MCGRADATLATPRAAFARYHGSVNATTASLSFSPRIIALDPATGQQRWAYDPHTNLNLPFGDGLINRGVATWLDSSRSEGAPCRRRISRE